MESKKYYLRKFLNAYEKEEFRFDIYEDYVDIYSWDRANGGQMVVSHSTLDRARTLWKTALNQGYKLNKDLTKGSMVNHECK